MKRVASLFLPHWPIERLRRAERINATPPDTADATLAALGQRARAEQRAQCDAPRDSGWRPGARWARDAPDDSGWGKRDEVAARIAALPAHQRPPMREMGRRSEAAAMPFKRLPGDLPEAAATEAIGSSGPIDRPSPFAGLDPNADDRAAAAFARWRRTDGEQAPRNTVDRLSQWAVMPTVHGPGDGPHPDKHDTTLHGAMPATYGRGSNDPGAAIVPFFSTGRSSAATVARTCHEALPGKRPDSGRHRGAAPQTIDHPLVTTEKIGARHQIAAACPAAQALGLTPGMAVTQARACVPDLAIRDADRAGDHAALHDLALLLARRWAPVVAASGDDGLLIDLTGVAHLHGGETRMTKRLVRLLARYGFTARIAVADTAGAAWALVRHVATATLSCPPGEQARALAPLPAAALRIDAVAIDLLGRLGIDTIGQLAALPRAPLARRFGVAVGTRLDQALGRLPEPFDPVVPVERIAIVERFAEPIATPEAIAHALGTLVRRTTRVLAEAGLGARRIDLVADRVDHVPQRLRVGLSRPSRDAAHLLRLMLRRIEEMEPGYGLDALALHVRRADPLGPEAIAAALEATDPDIAPLVDALANRIGAGQLWRAAAIDCDVPERSVAAAAPLDPPPVGEIRLKPDDVRQLCGQAADHVWHPRWPRPVRLLHRPERIDHVLAELPDQPPRRFTWRGHLHRIVRADGPERITGEWWRRRGERNGVRDYYQVEDEQGRRFWLFRRGDGVRSETGDLSWYMHGAFG